MTGSEIRILIIGIGIGINICVWLFVLCMYNLEYIVEKKRRENDAL